VGLCYTSKERKKKLAGINRVDYQSLVVKMRGNDFVGSENGSSRGIKNSTLSLRTLNKRQLVKKKNEKETVFVKPVGGAKSNFERHESRGEGKPVPGKKKKTTSNQLRGWGGKTGSNGDNFRGY